MDKKKMVTTAAFVVVVGGVLAAALALGTQERPPRMPPGPEHKLRFSLKGELIGVDAEPPVDLTTPNPPGFVYELRPVEEKINNSCLQCHAVCDGTPPSAGAPPCRGQHHPPKTECIKCHREAPRAPPAAPAPPPPP
jgi:hypothetical protein